MNRWVFIPEIAAHAGANLAESRARLGEIAGATAIKAEKQADGAHHFALDEEGITRFRTGQARSLGWVEHDRPDPWTTPAGPAAAPGGIGKWAPWLLLAGALILVLILFRTCSGREAPTAPPGDPSRVEAPAVPAAPTATLPGPVSTGLAGFLASSEPTPRRFVFDNLNYETESARLAADARATVTAVATTLKAYPNARVAVVGFTDSEGDDAANLQLSQDRARSVAQALTEQGVAASRIEASGRGEGDPLASNDTEEGRAQNRRTELVVLSR